MDKKRIFIAGVGLFVAWCALLCWWGVYTFSYQESLGTFFYTSTFVRGTLAEPGGVARIVSLFLTQFFICPYAGVVIISALLTILTMLTANVMKRLGGNYALAPIAALPAMAVAMLNYNVNYSNSGTVALLAAALSLWGQIRISKIHWQLAYAVTVTAVLSYGFGPVAMLYGVMSVVVALMQKPRWAAAFLVCPVAAYVLGVLYVRLGMYGALQHVLMPAGYFTLRLTPGSFVNLPWVLMLVALLVGYAQKLLNNAKKWMTISAFAVTSVGVALFAIVGGYANIDRQNEQFKQMTYYINHQQWQKIIDMCATLPMTNLIHQNCQNLAFAESGVLADRLFDAPVYDIRSIYIEGEKQPYFKALLSDVYWSMGHLALAQRNAFEANESLDNISPRMILRLAQTNLAMKQYDVAAKYINLLSNTLYYKEIAAHYATLLNDEQALIADRELGPKSRCVFPDNRFSAYKGLDDDLRQVMRANPEYATTVQYLGALYLLSKDLPHFAEVISEYYGSDTVAKPLPKAFAEGMLLRYKDSTDSVATRYQIPAVVTDRFNAFWNNHNNDTHTFWYFYGYVK